MKDEIMYILKNEVAFIEKKSSDLKKSDNKNSASTQIMISQHSAEVRVLRKMLRRIHKL